MARQRGGRKRMKPREYQRHLRENVLAGKGHDSNGDPTTLRHTSEAMARDLYAGYRAERAEQ